VPERASLSASIAAALGLIAVAAAAVGPLLAHLGLATPFVGFRVFALGLLSGVPTLALAALGLLRTRGMGGPPGRNRAWLGAAIGLVLVALLLALALPARGLPRINDITTDPDDPPVFRAALAIPANRDRDLAYPGPSFANAQRAAYPDLRAIRVALPPPVAFEAARRAALALGWDVHGLDPVARVFEATDTSPLFLFVDDVAVRVQPGAGGSRIDVRSKSRDGVGDVGANARRIRAFAQALGDPLGP
jgi:hypothetical protein